MDTYDAPVVYRDTHSLRPHPVRERLHQMRSCQEIDSGLFANIAELGIVVPILLAADGRVLKGMRRVEGAMRAGIETVPCLFATEGLELASLTAAAFARAHHTKSAVAYMLWPIVEPLAEEARAYQRMCLKQGTEPAGTRVPSKKPTSVGELWQQYEVSKPDYLAAQDCHRFLAGQADKSEYVALCPMDRLDRARAAVEKSVFEEGSSIRKWRVVVAGCVSARNDLTGGKPEVQLDFDSLLNSAKTFGRRWSNPAAWLPERKAETRRLLCEEWTALPDTVVDELIDTLREVKRAKVSGETR